MVEKKLDPAASICISVITSYPKWYQGALRSIKHTDKIRGDLALETFRVARKNGYQVVSVNGLSAKTFTKELASIDGVLSIKRRTNRYGPAKRQSIKAAAAQPGVKVIILMEPEKVELIASIPLLAAPILSKEADIIIPKRNDDLFRRSHPDYMYVSEVEGNALYNTELRSQGILSDSSPDLDLFFGPRALCNDPKVVALFTKKYTYRGKSVLGTLSDPELYSTTIFFPIIRALRKKLKVKSVEIDFTYPALQTENEMTGAKEVFIAKRKLQRMKLLIDLMHFLSLKKSA